MAEAMVGFLYVPQKHELKELLRSIKAKVCPLRTHFDVAGRAVRHAGFPLFFV